jgi:hypothetical protein
MLLVKKKMRGPYKILFFLVAVLMGACGFCFFSVAAA